MRVRYAAHKHTRAHTHTQERRGREPERKHNHIKCIVFTCRFYYGQTHLNFQKTHIYSIDIGGAGFVGITIIITVVVVTVAVVVVVGIFIPYTLHLTPFNQLYTYISN